MSAISKQELLVRIRKLKPKIMKRYKAKGIELFGSIVREGQSEASDIDLLVEFEEGADLLDLTGLAIFLEEELGRKVDVVPKRALREELRQSVLNEAVPV